MWRLSLKRWLMTHLPCCVLCTHVTMATQFKCFTVNSLESKLCEVYTQSRWTLDSSGFLQQDLDMWDTKSRFTAQTSAWCGMSTVSGTGFLSKVSTSTSGSTGEFRQNDPGLRRWQSLSHLEPESATRSFSPSLGAEVRASRGEGKSKQSEVVQWLQDAHERLDTQLEHLRARDSQLSYHIIAARLLDKKHKHLSEAMSTLEQEKGGTNLSQFEKSQSSTELHKMFQNLEKDLLPMRSTLDRGSNDEPSERTPDSLSRSLLVSQEDSNRHEKQKVDTELCKVREAETSAKTREEEQNQVFQQLQSSIETQRILLNQIEELKQRLSHTVQNHSQVQEQLTEANNKISQACLEKAILSTQVLKLEDNIKDLKARLTEALSDKRDLIQENADLQRVQVLELQLERTKPGSDVAELHDNAMSHNNKQDKETALMKEESKVLREVNEKLTRELEMLKQRLDTLQCQLQETTAERVSTSKQITDLETENSQLFREKEEALTKTNEGEDKCCQLRESVEVLQLEKQKLQDQCLCLEAKCLEQEEKLQLQEEEHLKKDAVRVKTIQELKTVASHWTEKWQKVALTLQSTLEELEDLKKNDSTNELQLKVENLANEIEKLQKKGEKDKEKINNLLQQKVSLQKLLADNKKESDSLLRVELDACKQELELERSRSQTLLHRFKDKSVEAVQTKNKETVTDLSKSSLLWEPPSDSYSSQNRDPLVCTQNSEIQWMKVKLAEKEKDLEEKTEALMSLERLRETEKTESQIKISALELKLMRNASEDSRDSGGQANVSTTDSLRVQLEESRSRTNQLQQQRRRITEQLKNLFKEREEKEVGKVDNTAAAAAQTEAPSPQDWTSTPKAVRTAVDRWNWQQNSGLMPVFEEDEENSELPEEEEEKQKEEAQVQESLHNQRQQMSAMNAANINMKAKHENLLQALRITQTFQDLHTTAEKVSQSSDVDLPNLCSDMFDLQQKPYPYPDGIFLAERVDICSPDEDEEEGEDK